MHSSFSFLLLFPQCLDCCHVQESFSQLRRWKILRGSKKKQFLDSSSRAVDFENLEVYMKAKILHSEAFPSLPWIQDHTIQSTVGLGFVGVCLFFVFVWGSNPSEKSASPIESLCNQKFSKAFHPFSLGSL